MHGLSGAKKKIMCNPHPDNLLDVLLNNDCEITSPVSTFYNAIAWVVGGESEKERWWSPEPFAQYHWPQSLPKEETVETYEKLFQLHGYTPAVGNNSDFEPGCEKVAIYVKDGLPVHVAKQRRDGWWTSKLGNRQDIRHRTLESLEGEVFGTVHRILIREIAN